jgi:transposase InsO family protein
MRSNPSVRRGPFCNPIRGPVPAPFDNQAKADVFDYIERFYNARRRHSTIGYLSPVAFEEQAALA